MNPDPRVRTGAHRTRQAAGATVLPSLLAILAVSSLITALYVWRSEDVKQPRAAASSASKALGATKQTSPDPTATPTSPVTGRPEPSTAPSRRGIGIVVLNQTSRRGLAAIVAVRLRTTGWTVGGVGNFRGVVPATTVYYPVGQLGSAQDAAESLPTPPRIRPRFGNLSTTRLTVVVTTNYPS